MAVSYNTPVAIFSLEMSNVQLVNRLIINTCEIPGDKIKSGQLAPFEWERLMSRIEILRNAPIYIDDTPSLSVFELRTKARRLVREHGIKIIIIDYLQLMNASGMSFGSREQEVSTISRSLKQLAKELQIPIIALSQLNRSVESRGTTKTVKKGNARNFPTCVNRELSSKMPIWFALYTVPNIILGLRKMPMETVSKAWQNLS